MSQSQEFVVRVPQETNKKYHVMRFHAALNVDVTKWKNVKLERENNAREFKAGTGEGEMPTSGAGSEFGREAKEAARRHKYGSRAKKYNPDDQPWLLRANGKSGKRFRGIREGGVSENTSYYVFFQASDGAFEAFPVNEWYNFTTVQRYKALTAEEAEEQFEKRDKILNHFAVMVSKKKKDNEAADGGFVEEKPKKGKGGRGSFKVSDMDEWGMDSDAERDEEDEGDDEKPKGKGKGKKNGKKKAKKDSDDEEGSAVEESDEGDFDQREVDYMSAESSSEEEAEDDKVNREMKGVEDEDALRQLVMTDSEDEENAENADKGKETNLPTDETAKPEAEAKIKQEKPEEISDESAEDSDDSDFDESKFQSAVFMQKKAAKAAKIGSDHGSGPSSRSDPPSKEMAGTSGSGDAVDGEGSSLRAVKRKLDSSSPQVGTKKAKVSGDGSSNSFEDQVKRYLTRKPMTIKELLKKFTKSKNISMSREQIGQTITQVLRKLNPEKQKIKDELYLSLKS